jgi:transcriptional regulator with XRE-family HTH domain
MTIGKTIAYLRDVYSISQRELAKKIGMSKSVLNRVEQDSRPLRVDELVKIADYFDLSTDYILGRKEVSNILFTQRNILQEDTEMVRAYHAAPEAMQDVVNTALKLNRNNQQKDNLSEKEKAV